MGRMIIAQISDTHILARSSDNGVGARRAENLMRCVADINRRGADVVVHTGDSVHQGQADEYVRLREILSELDAPLFLVPGNRDRREALRTGFDHVSRLPESGDFLQYAIEDYPVRLVAIDSTDAGDRKGAFCARRRAWLKETLAREPEKPTILFMHHPPFDVPQHGYVGGYRRPQEAEELTALVGRNRQVKQLLCGHVHALHHVAWAGTGATIMPSVAADLRIADDAETQGRPAYLLHDVSSDGSIASRMQIAAD